MLGQKFWNRDRFMLRWDGYIIKHMASGFRLTFNISPTNHLLYTTGGLSWNESKARYPKLYYHCTYQDKDRTTNQIKQKTLTEKKKLNF